VFDDLCGLRLRELFDQIRGVFRAEEGKSLSE